MKIRAKISYLLKENAATIPAILSQPEAGVKHTSYGAAATICVGFLFLATVVSTQEAMNRRHIGVPQDWSQRHIIFSRDALLQHPEVISQEPRVLHQAMQRWQGRYSTIVPGLNITQTPSTGGLTGLDWNVTLPGGRISPNMYPSKFSFDPAAPPSCQNDYVVFGTTAAGVDGGRANLIAFNNLYAGANGICGLAPTVLFAYNTTTVTGGHILTSPVLSDDGTKIAFVESVSSSPSNPIPSCIFHVLTWTHEGAIGNAAPAPLTMMSVTISSTKNDNTSSPWVDYKSDTAYVGADDGKIYKITNVFRGTPGLAGGVWPVTVSANLHLTAPVLDANLGFLMVGSANGSLYQINTTSGALKSLAVGDKNASPNHGILSAPIIDVTNGTTFAVSSNDGTSGVLVEADTATLTELARANIGQASASGTGVSLYQPAFSDSYFTNPSSGVVRLCGTGVSDITPWQYAFGFSGRMMQTAPVFQQQLLASTTARCTGWTEFFNPKIGGGTDFFFFGLTADCTAPGAAGGCVVARTSDSPILTTATLAGGPTGIVVDNFSTAGQASSIYMMAKNANIAYKFKQTLGP